MNLSLVVGVLLQGLVALGVYDAYPALGGIAVIVAGVAVVAAAFMAWPEARPWAARVVMVASCPFVPLGFLAIYGATRELDRLAEKQFQDQLQKGSP